MSNSVAPAIKTANNEIPWNPKVRQKKQPSDYVVDFLIGLLVVAVVVVVLYPLWFIVSTLPLLVVYPFLQKYFNKGVMIGAVKG